MNLDPASDAMAVVRPATGAERLIVSPFEALAVVPVKLVRARVGLPWE